MARYRFALRLLVWILSYLLSRRFSPPWLLGLLPEFTNLMVAIQDSRQLAKR